MLVTVNWRYLDAMGKDEGWTYWKCLYAYLSPKEDEIFYIGKADRASVNERWKAKDKQTLWSYLDNDRRISHHVVSVGVLCLEQGNRFSPQLLSDVESLLIAYEQPLGNIQCKNSRISRPNLKVRCVGDWIGAKFYLDS